MTAFVLPCGISLLTNLLESREPCWEGRGELVQPTERVVRKATDARGDDWCAAIATGYTTWLEHAPLLAEALRTSDCPDVSAEKACLGVVGPNRRPARRAPDDPVVLLASDTPEGLLAAHLNAALLGGPIETYEEPPTDHAEPIARTCGFCEGAGMVAIVRIPGLKPESASGLAEAAQGVERAFRWVTERFPDEERVLHLAGGYKAMVPVFLFAAHRVGGFSGIWCKHETTESAIRFPTTREELNRWITAGQPLLAGGDLAL